ALSAVTSSGQFGVHLFFVVSALTLLSSWHWRNDGAAQFYMRRLLRVAPMFWVAACVYLIIFGRATSGLTVPGIIATFLFMSWYPDTMNALVPGGWTIAAEVMFYIIFPFFAASIKSLSAAIVAFIAVAIAIFGGDLIARLLLPIGEEIHLNG